MAISFISSKDFKETCTMYTISNSIETLGNERDEVNEELFNFPLQKYQEVL